MPTYDLACKACGHTFEVALQRFITDDDKVCPNCSSKDVEQKMSQFEFRGTPWRPTKGMEKPLRSQAKFQKRP
jgi:putative FmdB family regulatory protein